MNEKYAVMLGDRRIGIARLGRADPYMGVVMGQIEFEGIASPYQLLRDYCQNNNVAVDRDDPEDEAIFTQSIEGLRVFNETGVEIEGQGAIVSGFKDEGYYIEIFGIPHPFYAREFER